MSIVIKNAHPNQPKEDKAKGRTFSCPFPVGDLPQQVPVFKP